MAATDPFELLILCAGNAQSADSIDRVFVRDQTAQRFAQDVFIADANVRF